jgi:hypothetical protein
MAPILPCLPNGSQPHKTLQIYNKKPLEKFLEMAYIIPIGETFMTLWIDPTFASWLPLIGYLWLAGVLLVCDLNK